MNKKCRQLCPDTFPDSVPGASGYVEKLFLLLLRHQASHKEKYGQQKKNIRPRVFHGTCQSLAWHPAYAFIRESGIVLCAFFHIPGRKGIGIRVLPAEDSDAAEHISRFLHRLQINAIACAFFPFFVQFLNQTLILLQGIRQLQIRPALVHFIISLKYARCSL